MSSQDDSDPLRPSSTKKISSLKDSNGWDGKMRIEKKAIVTSDEPLSESDHSDDDPPPIDQIDADEGYLLDELDEDTEDIDLVHCRIKSIPPLRLDRFLQLERLCLRQNQISKIDFPGKFGSTMQDLDLYDNLIKHVGGLEELGRLHSLDLSFNKIKHIKNVNHLKQLRNIYFVQNRIQKIENLEGLDQLRNLELAANRIREIENLGALANLEELWLGKNKIAELQNLSLLTNLKILSIQSNRISTISGLGSLNKLEELYISHNALNSISGLEHNQQLRVLDISNNQIDHLSNLNHLQHLEELWASSNDLSSFDEVEDQLGDKKELKTVYLEGNPLQTKQPTLYRNKVRLALPQILQIDAST
ncbi:MAG: hypothetical protein Q9167_004710 [Letrouitia subvulpina]